MFLSKVKYLTAVPIVLLLACSHGLKKAEVDTSQGPTAALNNLRAQVGVAKALQADVIAPEEYEEGREYFKEANELMNEEDMDTQEFYNKVGFGKAYLDKAIAETEKRKKAILTIANARKAALDAGVLNNSELSKELNDIDQDLRSYSSNFVEKLEPEEYASLQDRYLALEVKSIQARELGAVKSRIDMAVDKRAEEKAPLNLKAAQTDYSTALNLIKSSPRQPLEYRNQVQTAEVSSHMLTDVMEMIRAKGGELDETVAIELVSKNKKLSNQETQISEMSDSLGKAGEEIVSLDDELNQNKIDLREAQGKAQFEEVVKEASQEFSSEEAEVYHQDNNLVIRLKNLNFPIGSSKVPKNAKPVIDKIRSLVSQINLDRIVVEGHADATGSEALNKTLSKNRAKNIAELIRKDFDISVESKGLGAEKPLAVNTTKEGRALNRRVDVIITARN